MNKKDEALLLLVELLNSRGVQYRGTNEGLALDILRLMEELKEIKNES